MPPSTPSIFYPYPCQIAFFSSTLLCLPSIFSHRIVLFHLFVNQLLVIFPSTNRQYSTIYFYYNYYELNPLQSSLPRGYNNDDGKVEIKGSISRLYNLYFSASFFIFILISTFTQSFLHRIYIVYFYIIYFSYFIKYLAAANLFKGKVNNKSRKTTKVQFLVFFIFFFSSPHHPLIIIIVF